MRIALLYSKGTPAAQSHAAGLADRGHDIALLTGHGDPMPELELPGVTLIRCWRPPPLRSEGYYEDHITQVPSLIWHLFRGRFDVAHAFFTAGAWAAAQARRLGGPPVIFTFTEGPDRRYLVARHYRLEMLRAAIEAASECVVPNELAARPFERYLLRPPRVVPGGTDGPDPDAETLTSWYEGRYRSAVTGFRAGEIE